MQSSSQKTRRVGLARALSKLGHCSRSQAFVLIRASRVAVNGAVRRDPEFPVDPLTAQIFVDGERIAAAEPVNLALNKPRGIVTTAADEQGRETVYALLPPDLPWVAPVGRLDKASEGLLLLTNDSEWAARITAPESHLPKTYHVQIAAKADEGLFKAMKAGVVHDGERLQVQAVSLLREGQKHCWLEIVLDEGRNRHIRRMLQAFDIQVLRLVRVAIGPLTLGDLPKRKSRALTVREKEALDRALAAGPNFESGALESLKKERRLGA